jgi:hypothetical protein
MMELYLNSPMRLHGVMLNQLSTGTTLMTRGSSVGIARGYQLEVGIRFPAEARDFSCLKRIP